MCTFQILGNLSGSEDRGGVTTVSNSLILGGWVTKVLKNCDKKIGGGWQQYFDFSYITGSTKNATLKNCILDNFFYSYLQSFLIHRLLYWFEIFVIRPETALISQFLVVQISSAKFQSMCFKSLRIILQH